MKTSLVVPSLLLFLSSVQSQPLSFFSSGGHDIVFPSGSPGLAQLEDVPVDGDSLTVSLASKTGEKDGQLFNKQQEISSSSPSRRGFRLSTLPVWRKMSVLVRWC